MAIPDPHAIPETADACTEYVTEADAAWDGSNSDLAYDLYNAVRNSNFATEIQLNHVTLRLGLIAEARGDIDNAVIFFHASHDPAARDALHALTNATTHDREPDPTVVPGTAEEAFAWIDAALAAERANDWQKALDFYEVILQSPVLTPGQQGTAYVRDGAAREKLGHTDDARTMYELSLSLLSDNDQIAFAQGRIKALGGGHAFAGSDAPIPDDDSPAAAQVEAGVVAYENADGAGAKKAFEAALHLEGTAETKGRAHYYLAAMQYQWGQYADSRDHLDAALTSAPEPERSWAQGMLAWRWDEHPAAASAQAPAAAAGEVDPGY
jgi:tetratricopeptide (TPR) repeat protein